MQSVVTSSVDEKNVKYKFLFLSALACINIKMFLFIICASSMICTYLILLSYGERSIKYLSPGVKDVIDVYCDHHSLGLAPHDEQD